MTYDVDELKKNLNDQGILGEGRDFLCAAIDENDRSIYAATRGSMENYLVDGEYDDVSLKDSVKLYAGCSEIFEEMSVLDVDFTLEAEGMYPIIIPYEEPRSKSQKILHFCGPGKKTYLNCDPESSEPEILELEGL